MASQHASPSYGGTGCNFDPFFSSGPAKFYPFFGRSRTGQAKTAELAFLSTPIKIILHYT